jgi:hypothetical protein
MKETKTYPLRLPRSLREAVARVSKQEGTSINQFIAIAVAEKVSAVETARFFETRREQVDWQSFDRILNRPGGEPPRDGDQVPEEGELPR